MVQLAKMAKVRTCTNKEQAIDKYTKIRKHLKYIQGNKKQTYYTNYKINIPPLPKIEPF